MKKNNKLLWIYILSASIYFTQGIEGLPGLSLFFYLKEKLGFTPEKIMYIGSIAGLAWLIKPLWGYLCDNFLSNKKWIILSLLGSISIAFYFGLSSLLPSSFMMILLSLASFNAALRDVSVDGIMCIDGKKTNTCDKIQALQWTAITIASILVGLGGGYIADHYSYKVGYLCLIPVYLIIVGIVLRYRTTVSENRTEENSCANCKFGFDCNCDNNICEGFQKRIIVQKHTMNCTKIYNELYKIIQSIVSYKKLFVNKEFLFACLFLFLYKYNPSFGTPLSFIERDVFKWSGQWMGTLGAIVSCFEILGAIIFFKMCKKINIKKWLYISVFLGAITTLCYLYFTPISAIIYGIIFSILGMFVHLIVMSWMAKSTLPGKEATSFALLCSINNLAGTASSLSGAFLFPKIGLQPLIIISALTSFVCLPILKRLKINENKIYKK
jgi:predicted MFS family arabinose efflux permease